MRYPRRMLVLVLAILITPTLVSASTPNQTVNAVLGDVSYVERFGVMPTIDTPEQLRITVHLEYVLALLEAKPTTHLSDDARRARQANIERLREYKNVGVFPANFDYPDQRRPCFVDRLERICAVGYLIRHSAGDNLVRQINARYQYGYVRDMDMSELAVWVANSGLTGEEVAMIQPAYANATFDGTVTPPTGPAPLAVRFDGVIRTQSSGPGTIMSYVLEDLGGRGVLLESGPLGIADTAVVDTTIEFWPGGTFLIFKVTVDDGFFGAMPWVFLPSVSATAPSFSLSPVVDDLTLTLQTSNIPDLGRIDQATIDWNDPASGPEVFTWTAGGIGVQTPAHTYSTAGDYTVVITHRYDGIDCSLDHSETIVVSVGETTATEPSTWGRVKALYAGL